MTLHAPAYIQGNNYPAEDDRHAVFAAHGTGVVDGLVVTQRAGGANMTVDVSAGHAVLPVESGKTGVWSDALASVPIGAAPPADSRIDVVYALVSGSTWVFGVQPGTVAVAPVAPTIPTYGVPLARVTVAAGTAAITNAMITNVSRLSMPLALTQWPIVEAVTMTAPGNFGAGPVTWGSLVLPAPNRPVKVVATATVQVQVPASGSVQSGTVRLRCSHSSTDVDGPQWETAMAIGSAADLTMGVSDMFTIDPTGAVTVSTRITSAGGTGVVFGAGRLIATMYPR